MHEPTADSTNTASSSADQRSDQRVSVEHNRPLCSSWVIDNLANFPRPFIHSSLFTITGSTTTTKSNRIHQGTHTDMDFSKGRGPICAKFGEHILANHRRLHNSKSFQIGLPLSPLRNEGSLKAIWVENWDHVTLYDPPPLWNQRRDGRDVCANKSLVALQRWRSTCPATVVCAQFGVGSIGLCFDDRPSTSTTAAAGSCCPLSSLPWSPV